MIDETGAHLEPPLRQTWAPQGETPVVKAWRRPEKISAVAALTISPRRGRLGLYWEVQRDAYRTGDFVRFVRALRRQLGAKLLVVWDNLRGHHAAQRRCRGRGVVFEYLPPYAPDLCAVEPVWGHTKGNALANWAPEDTDELENAVHDHLADLNHTPPLLRSFFAAAGLQLMRPLKDKGRG